MKLLKTQMSTAVSLILILSIAVSLLASVQTIKAADIPTYSFIAASANPVGVGQAVLVTVWLDRYPPPAPGFQGAAAYWKWTVTITNPNGNTETKNVVSDTIGATSFLYTPSIVGTYKFKAVMEENTETADTYLSSTSKELSLVVQEEPIGYIQGAPLPTEYWTRPIYAENYEWASLTANWLMGDYNTIRDEWTSRGAFSPYTTAPNTAHVMWTKPLADGGVAGGEWAPFAWYPRLQYEVAFDPSMIIQGRLYYNLPLGTSPEGGGFACVDLRTGEELWRKPDGVIWVAQMFNYNSLNQHGICAYLWDLGRRRGGVPGNNYYDVFDAFSGEFIFRIPGSLGGGDFVSDEIGSLIGYFMGGSNPNRWLAMWNSTRCIERATPAPGSGWGAGNPDYWRPLPTNTYNWTDGIQWNVTVPDVGTNPSIARVSPEDGAIIARASIGAGGSVEEIVVEVCYEADTGAQRWAKNRMGDEATKGQMAGFSQNMAIRDGVYAKLNQETLQWYGYSLATGNKIWETDPRPSDWGLYAQSAVNIAYDKFYAGTYDGHVIAYDLETGETVWDYYAGNSGFETPYDSWPFYWFLSIADGKVFATNGEHSPNSPMYRGARLHVIDAETGEPVWNISGWFQAGRPCISDGYYAGLNGYDMQIYSFGKGPSTTTVEAPTTAVELGSSLVIRGSVTDISAGTKQNEQAARFPNGVPAMADEDMIAWMEYVYQQKPIPTDAKGVEVWIDVLDSNGNYRNIGTTTSDMSGFYTFTWEPDIPGDFTVVATFAGSESYWPSYSETSFTVVEPTVTPAPTPPPASMTDTYVTGFGIGMIITIIVATIAIILVLRKR